MADCSLQQGVLVDGITVALTKRCDWFGALRGMVSSKPMKAALSVNPRFSNPIKQMIGNEPPFGYRGVAWLMGLNKTAVQRFFQIKGWQVAKRPIGMRPRSEAVPSLATASNMRPCRQCKHRLSGNGFTDPCRVWSGRDGWTTPAMVIDGHTRALLCWHLSRQAGPEPPASALQHILIHRFGPVSKVTREFLLRFDNGRVFTSHRYIALIQGCGLKQDFITPHCPQQTGMVERVPLAV